MKRGELERKLKALGWFFHHSGGKHDVWAHNVKTYQIYVPRHAVINMNTARSILRDAAK
jgi:predicted RNA binding protein YcfA (HicA-like mRNA interferase family)